MVLSLYDVILSLYDMVLSLYDEILSLYDVILSLYDVSLSLYDMILSLYDMILSLYDMILSLYDMVLSLYDVLLSSCSVILSLHTQGLIERINRLNCFYCPWHIILLVANSLEFIIFTCNVFISNTNNEFVNRVLSRQAIKITLSTFFAVLVSNMHMVYIYRSLFDMQELARHTISF
jgi:hypothetical protein